MEPHPPGTPQSTLDRRRLHRGFNTRMPACDPRSSVASPGDGLAASPNVPDVEARFPAHTHERAEPGPGVANWRSGVCSRSQGEQSWHIPGTRSDPRTGFLQRDDQVGSDHRHPCSLLLTPSDERRLSLPERRTRLPPDRLKAMGARRVQFYGRIENPAYDRL